MLEYLTNPPNLELMPIPQEKAARAIGLALALLGELRELECYVKSPQSLPHLASDGHDKARQRD